MFKEEELGEISVTRNPIIADCMQRAGFVEKIGSGIKRIRELFPKVKFETSSGWFKVILEREILNVNLNEELKHPLKHPLKELYVLINRNPGINREQLSRLNGGSINTLKDQIKKLVDEDLIERKGSRKTGGYFIK